ncbi:MAG: hypothetical protein IKR86_08220 [Candidatus Methanomethylophilaceae archaeon]|nr:hypothetical protein [Candidatus Methanomethylophilaceae archaeon]
MDDRPTYWDMFLPTLLDRLSFHMHKDLDECVKKYGLNSHHVQYLMALSIHDGQTLVGLSKFLDIDNGNTHRVVKFLKENGFVYDDRKDSRSKKYHIFLTERGRQVAEEITEAVSELNRQYFSELTSEELRVVKKVSSTAVGKVLQSDMQQVEDSTPYFVRLGSFSDLQDDQKA